MSNSIAPGSSADVNVRVTALTTNPNVPAQYKTIILKKNFVNGVNTLTQAMMNQTNTKYVIKYDYVLGEDINVPAGCILEFDGGSISGAYTITGQNTGIQAGLIKILNTDVIISGKWSSSVVYPEWFGVQHGVDCTNAMNAAVRMLSNIDTGFTRGGTLHLSNKSYICGTISITYEGYFKLEGEGKGKTFINNPDDDAIRVSIEMPNSNITSIYIHDLTIQGPGGLNPSGVGLSIATESGKATHKGVFRNIEFNGLNTGIILGDVYVCNFDSISFGNYIVGMTGVSGKAANNNNFISCVWGDGRDATVSKPIVSYCMGYNTFINCDFEASKTLKCVDMRGGSGWDTFYSCRFERINNGDDNWVYAGNHQRFINCGFFADGYWGTTSPSGNDVTYLLYIEGDCNVIEPLTVVNEIKGNRMCKIAGSHNTVYVEQSSSANLSVLYNIVSDFGNYNSVKYLNTDIKDKLKINAIQNNIALTSSAIWDSNVTSFFEYTVGTQPNVLGYFNIGNSFVMNPRTSATTDVKWKLTDATIRYYTYVFSIMILINEGQHDVELYISDGTNDIAVSTVNMPANKWCKLFIAYNHTSSAQISLYAGIRGGTYTTFVQYPQFNETPTPYLLALPQNEIVFTGNSGSVGNVKDGIYSTNAPTVSRTYYKGEIVYNIDYDGTNPFCWVCTAGGTPGTWTARN